jgi:hypothetical protein
MKTINVGEKSEGEQRTSKYQTGYIYDTYNRQSLPTTEY